MDKTAVIAAHRAALHATLDDLRATAGAGGVGGGSQVVEGRWDSGLKWSFAIESTGGRVTRIC